VNFTKLLEMVGRLLDLSLPDRGRIVAFSFLNSCQLAWRSGFQDFFSLPGQVSQIPSLPSGKATGGSGAALDPTVM